jgi:nitrate/nitrite transport system permease protein
MAAMKISTTLLPSNVPVASAIAKPVISATVQRRLRNERILKVVAPVLGIALMLILWEIISKGGKTIPGPWVTFQAGLTAFADPFYVNGPNDQGIGYKIMNSLGRVGLGFGLAAIVGIPVGFAI